MRKINSLCSLLTVSLMGIMSACATNPYALQDVRIQCNQTHPAWQSSINDYISCVQKKDYDEYNNKNKKDVPWLNMERGLKTLAEGKIKPAQKMFEQAAEAIETIYGDSPQAKKARSAFSQEADKIFIGETHERAMVFHYLGLIDLVQGNYQNARASFRASLLQDSLSANEKHRQDFASSSWLRGWSAQCLGQTRTAQKDFEKAKRDFGTSTPSRLDNLLVVAEMGQGPFKAIAGKYGEKLIYTKQKATSIESSFRSASFGLFKSNNLYFQATTRGDRNFDDYLKAQSEDKDTAYDIAKVAAVGALVAFETADAMGDQGGAAAAVGLGLAAVAGVSALVGSAINPVADTRTWRTLPDSIYIGSFKVPESAKDIRSLRGGGGDQQLSRLVRWAEGNREGLAIIFSGKGKCRILWVRDESFDR